MTELNNTNGEITSEELPPDCQDVEIIEQVDIMAVLETPAAKAYDIDESPGRITPTVEPKTHELRVCTNGI
jgi:hypothetical protein